MNDLVSFLRARLDEDEAAARAVAPLGYTTDMGGTRLDEEFSHARVRFAGEDGRSRTEGDAAAGRHFGRHDPARVLREVEAKRAILALAEQEPQTHEEAEVWRTLGTEVLPQIATVYSDHPDYNPDWKP